MCQQLLPILDFSLFGYSNLTFGYILPLHFAELCISNLKMKK